MNYQRITISLPSNTYTDVLAIAGKGNVSSFIANATKSMVLDKKLTITDPIDAFLAHRDKLPKLTDAQIMANIRRGRT